MICNIQDELESLPKIYLVQFINPNARSITFKPSELWIFLQNKGKPVRSLRSDLSEQVRLADLCKFTPINQVRHTVKRSCFSDFHSWNNVQRHRYIHNQCFNWQTFIVLRKSIACFRIILVKWTTDQMN